MLQYVFLKKADVDVDSRYHSIKYVHVFLKHVQVTRSATTNYPYSDVRMIVSFNPQFL